MFVNPTTSWLVVLLESAKLICEGILGRERVLIGLAITVPTLRGVEIPVSAVDGSSLLNVLVGATSRCGDVGKGLLLMRSIVSSACKLGITLVVR